MGCACTTAYADYNSINYACPPTCDKALSAVNRVQHPHIARPGSGTKLQAMLLPKDSMLRAGAPDQLPHDGFGLLVGNGHRGRVRLGLYIKW